MNKGKYVFSQIMTYFPRWVFEDSIKKYKGDFHAKNLNSYSHCLHLMFGQLAGCKSLKDITLVLRSVNKAAYHLGIPVVVDSSSLSKANDLVGIVGDKTIHLSGYVSEKKYPEDLRLIEFYDAEKDEIITFITKTLNLDRL